MANNKDEKDTSVAKAIKSVAPTLTLDEFCARLSENDKRYTLIAGFHFTELTASRLSDTTESYAARFAAFIKQPA